MPSRHLGMVEYPSGRPSVAPVRGEGEYSRKGHPVEQLVFVRVHPAPERLHLLLRIVGHKAPPKELVAGTAAISVIQARKEARMRKGCKGVGAMDAALPLCTTVHGRDSRG